MDVFSEDQVSYIKLTFGSPIYGSHFVREGDTIQIDWLSDERTNTKQTYLMQVRRSGIVMVKKQFSMKAIRFLPSVSDQGNIHQYIFGPKDEAIDAIWKMMKDPEDGEHCFYRNPASGTIELPKPDIEYEEISVKDALFFEVHEPAFEAIERLRRERQPRIPKVGKILDRFPDEVRPNRVMFKRATT